MYILGGRNKKTGERPLLRRRVVAPRFSAAPSGAAGGQEVCAASVWPQDAEAPHWGMGEEARKERRDVVGRAAQRPRDRERETGIPCAA